MIPILYLHGFTSSPASRKARYFYERFAGIGVPMAIPDLDGGDFARLTLSGQLRVIEREAGGRPVSLIGSSMGGYLAALYAARHPEVRRVVMMAPAFDFGRRWIERVGEEGMEQWRRTGSLTVYHYAQERETALGYQLIQDARLFEDYPEVRQPALIFHGRRDDVVPLSASERFADGRPNVTLRALDSDHELGDVIELMWEETASFLLGPRTGPR